MWTTCAGVGHFKTRQKRLTPQKPHNCTSQIDSAIDWWKVSERGGLFVEFSDGAAIGKQFRRLPSECGKDAGIVRGGEMAMSDVFPMLMSRRHIKERLLA